MSITATLSEPYYRGARTAVGIGTLYSCAIGGRGFLIDWKSGEYRAESVARIRTQGDASDLPGEQSLNPEGLWRRSVEDWTAGAGQTYYDRSKSRRDRYRSSKGIDPWTHGEIRLLPDVRYTRISENADVNVAVCGSYLYCTDGGNLYVSSDGIAWTQVTGVTGLFGLYPPTSDGATLFVSNAADIYKTTAGSGAATTALSSPLAGVTIVQVAKQRLLAAGTGGGSSVTKLYQLTVGAAAPAAWFTHPNAGWTWTGICEGPASIFFSGYVGEKSAIYATAIKQDGTGLDAPHIAGELPEGEVAYSICSYLGYLFIGTNRGVRAAVISQDGGTILAVGDVIPTSAPVRCFEPQDRFVWFGWTNYDAGSSGLGRLDLRTAIDTATFAWASDLMAPAAGDVTSVVTFAGRRAFTVRGSAGVPRGVYIEDPVNKVESGEIISGYIGFGITDPKTAMRVRTRHAAGAGTYEIGLARDRSSTYGKVGPTITSSAVAADGATVAASFQRAESFEVRLKLMRAAGDPSQSPVITRWTLLADPASGASQMLTVPFIIARTLQLLNNSEVDRDPWLDRRFLEGLWQQKGVVSYQEARGGARNVTVENFRWIPDHRKSGPTNEPFEGTMIVQLKESEVA